MHAYINLSYCYYAGGQYAKRLDIAIEGHRLFPKNAGMLAELAYAHHGLGWLSMQENKQTEARRHFERAYELYPEGVDIIAALAIVLRSSDKASEVYRSVTLLLEARQKDPAKSYIQNNLIAAFESALQHHVKERDYQAAEELIDQIYRDYAGHPRLYQQEDKEHLDVINTLDMIIQSPYWTLPDQLHPDTKALLQLSESLGRILGRWPDNYRLRHTLGVAYTLLGKELQGTKVREQAYQDYRRLYNIKEPLILLDVPLRGRIYSFTRFDDQGISPKSHSGLWHHAIDYTILHPDRLQNISYDKPVYSPAAGTVTAILNTHPIDSYIRLELDTRLSLEMVHFKPGSIAVKVGQKIRQGEYLGKLGWSENAHLHMHIWNRYGVTIPYKFRQFRDKEGLSQKNAMPVRGQAFFYP
ncbi:MAG: peptidoglycan DD-metalloendopeptidase family protein [Leptospiraceae bacterium]|nr:peptidoglycan DD-metalloendopeptidase family protein [Leptospiraceae bacterium]